MNRAQPSWVREGTARTSTSPAPTSALGSLDGLARTLPISAFSPGAIGLTRASAEELGVTETNAASVEVSLDLRGTAHRLKVATVLGREAAGALAQAPVAVLELASLQRFADLQGRLTRILIETSPGHEASVRVALNRLADGRITVATTGAEVALLHQALHPSDQASGFFAAISALLGFLFAFNAMLLTVPERRQAIADLRLIGTKRAAIVQIVAFQALCLGIAASLVGLLAGYALSLGAFHQSSGYLAEAFTSAPTRSSGYVHCCCRWAAESWRRRWPRPYRCSTCGAAGRWTPCTSKMKRKGARSGAAASSAWHSPSSPCWRWRRFFTECRRRLASSQAGYWRWRLSWRCRWRSPP